jgi:hypothetical protein
MKRRIGWVMGGILAAGVGVSLWLARPVEPAADKNFHPPVVSERKRPITIDQLASPEIPPQEKIQRLYQVVQNYQQVVKNRPGPPLSSNREFTRALTGHNVLKVKFLPPDHPSISPEGEILDAWGTPYFFHRLAADSLEIQSAGPDRVAFNSDDLIFPPPKPFSSLLESIRSAGMQDGARAMKRPASE